MYVGRPTGFNNTAKFSSPPVEENKKENEIVLNQEQDPTSTANDVSRSAEPKTDDFYDGIKTAEREMRALLAQEEYAEYGEFYELHP